MGPTRNRRWVEMPTQATGGVGVVRYRPRTLHVRFKETIESVHESLLYWRLRQRWLPLLQLRWTNKRSSTVSHREYVYTHIIGKQQEHVPSKVLTFGTVSTSRALHRILASTNVVMIGHILDRDNDVDGDYGWYWSLLRDVADRKQEWSSLGAV